MQYPKENPPPYGMSVPPPHYPQAAPPQIQQVQVIHSSFGPEPKGITCPRCHTNIVTNVRQQSTTKTHIVALIMCIVCCPFFWLPYCCDTCQATNHYCPKCDAYLGTYSN